MELTERQMLSLVWKIAALLFLLFGGAAAYSWQVGMDSVVIGIWAGFSLLSMIIAILSFIWSRKQFRTRWDKKERAKW